MATYTALSAYPITDASLLGTSVEVEAELIGSGAGLGLQPLE
jgi:hypothetical protein